MYELSLRYNLFRPGEPVKPFDLDTIGTDIPTELLKMIEKTQTTDSVVSTAAPKGKSDARRFNYKFHFPVGLRSGGDGVAGRLCLSGWLAGWLAGYLLVSWFGFGGSMHPVAG